MSLSKWVSMAERRGRERGKLTNDLNPDDPDFDLDQFIDEKSGSEEVPPAPGVSLKKPKRSTFKRDIIALTLLGVAAFLWYFDWNPMNAFGSSESNQLVTIVEGRPQAGDAISQGNTGTRTFPILDYMQAVQAMDFGSTPSESQIRALYNNGVPLEYIQKLDEVDFLDELNYSGVIALYANGVSQEYLDVLEELDYLDEVNYSGIVGLWANGVSSDYLRKLDEIDYLDEVNYSGIIGMYVNGVDEAYLEGLAKADYLDEVNYSGIIGLKANNVPIEFIQELRNRDLLDDMNYSQVISLYMNN